MNIWQYQQSVSRRLMQWSIVSMGLGVLMRFGGQFWKSVGNQFIAWGAIDAGIALGGQIATRNRVDRLENPGLVAVKQRESRNLGRLLWFNAALDMLYIFWGIIWMSRDNGDGRARGSGFGVVLQGLFLLLFDVQHAQNLPQEDE